MSSLKKLDEIFSLYIRLRDTDSHSKDGWFRCIQCGQEFRFHEGECGHFIPRRHLATRFNENNAHMQHVECNRNFNGLLYRQNLIEKIGEEAVKELETLKNIEVHLSQKDIDDLYDYFKGRVNEYTN